MVGNDTGGADSPNSAYPQCNPAGPVPGDCGEGIHLMGVYDSVVTGNYDSGNSGGVLITDEFGPTHDNLIASNVIKDNLFDCGVTVPGHNPFALDAKGNRQPSVAGDYNNVIAGNVITGNGVKGEGAGVIFANASAGSASYDNLVIHNYIAGNGLGGVTLHAHPIAPGTFEDLNGNNVIGNAIGRTTSPRTPTRGRMPHEHGRRSGLWGGSGDDQDRRQSDLRQQHRDLAGHRRQHHRQAPPQPVLQVTTPVLVQP